MVNARRPGKSNLAPSRLNMREGPKNFGGGSGDPAASFVHQDQSMQGGFKPLHPESVKICGYRNNRRCGYCCVGIRCFTRPISAHGSVRLAIRLGAVMIVNPEGSRGPASSSHSIGMATGAPGRDRVE